MLNHGKSDKGNKINCSFGNNTSITIWSDSICTGTIRVDKGSKCIWQKTHCDVNDLHIAIEIARKGEETGIFET